MSSSSRSGTGLMYTPRRSGSKEAPARLHSDSVDYYSSGNRNSGAPNTEGRVSRRYHPHRARSETMPDDQYSQNLIYCRLEGGASAASALAGADSNNVDSVAAAAAAHVGPAAASALFRRADIYETDLPALVRAADLGLKCGLVPALADGAQGGTYFLHSGTAGGGRDGGPGPGGGGGGGVSSNSRTCVAVFKPWDQEPHALNNPYSSANNSAYDMSANGGGGQQQQQAALSYKGEPCLSFTYHHSAAF